MTEIEKLKQQNEQLRAENEQLKEMLQRVMLGIEGLQPFQREAEAFLHGEPATQSEGEHIKEKGDINRSEASIRKVKNQARHMLGKVGLIKSAAPGIGNQVELLATIQSSLYFDPNWYVKTYPDVLQSPLTPAEHYLRFGGFEGRDPGPHFSSQGYLAKYDDVQAENINPLLHYERFGKAEGRKIVGRQGG